jgi:hypothetical protein
MGQMVECNRGFSKYIVQEPLQESYSLIRAPETQLCRVSMQVVIDFGVYHLFLEHGLGIFWRFDSAKREVLSTEPQST